MVRRLLYIVAALGLLLPVAAAAAPVEVVGYVGLNESTMHMDDLYSDAREGLAAGLGVRVPLSDTFALMPEIWYMQKGFKQGAVWEQIRLQGKLQTITVPVLLTYWFQARTADPRIFAGVAIDFVLKNEIDRRDDDAEWLDVTDESNSTYWSVVLGGGARLWDFFDVEARYQHAFTPVSDFDYAVFDDMIPAYQEFDDAFDRTWTLSVGYWF